MGLRERIDQKLREYAKRNPKEFLTYFYAYTLGGVWLIAYISKTKVVINQSLIPIWLYGGLFLTFIIIALWYRSIRKVDKRRKNQK